MNKAYELARGEIGTWEWADGSNPKVVQYYLDAGHPEVKNDEVAWCAAFVGAMLARAGLPNTGKLTARSYLEWGEPIQLEDAVEGDIVVFKRGNSSWQGHVGFFVMKVSDQIFVLGGNQGNQVSIKPFGLNNLLGVRRQPARPESAGWFDKLLKWIVNLFRA